MNSTSRKYSYCYQNSQWHLTRFQVESKLQSCLRIYILIMAEIPTADGLWKQAILATKRRTLLSDEKIETTKQSKADSVARKSNVNSDQNVNQLAEVLKSQDKRGRQLACKTSKLSSLRRKFLKKNLHSWTGKCKKSANSTKNLFLTCKHSTENFQYTNQCWIETPLQKKKGITQSISESQESRTPVYAHTRTLESHGFVYDKYFQASCTAGCRQPKTPTGVNNL